MTHRERMLAAIRGEPTDRIPWAPRMDLWSIALRARGTMPARFAGLGLDAIADVLGTACHAVRGDYTLDRDPSDFTLRAFGLENHPDFPFRVEVEGLEVEFAQRGADFTTRIRTRAGDVVTHMQRTAEMARAGISLPFTKRYPIRSVGDLEAVGEVFEHLRVVPTPEAYDRFHARIGDRGLAVAHGSLAASPMHLLLHDMMPMEQFFYVYADERAALERLAERMTPFFDASLEAVLGCAAEVVLWGANYDQDITPPRFFTAEIAPWLRRAAARVHASGKFLLTHTDGENRYLLEHYPGCDFDVAESVCPDPMTSCTLAEVRAGVGPRTTVFGGIPSIALLDNSMEHAGFESYLGGVFGALGSGERLILGVADNVPPDANLERLERITEWVERFGPVVPDAARVAGSAGARGGSAAS